MTVEQAIAELKSDIALYETEICKPGDGSPDGDLMEALEMAIAALEQESKWISVDDALPPDGQLVIGAIYTTDIIHLNADESLEDGLKRTNKEAEQHPRVEPCWYGHDGLGDPETVGWYGYDGFPMVCHPRYWMPLPQPPEVKE